MELFNGYSSPIDELAKLAGHLGISVIGMFAWALALTMLITMLGSWFARGKFWNISTIIAFVNTCATTAIATLDLTARSKESWPHIALLCILATTVCIGWSVYYVALLLNWAQNDDSHPGLPTIAGASVLKTVIWAALATTLLQNSMSGRWLDALYWSHLAVVFGVGVLILTLFVQIFYTRSLRKRRGEGESIWSAPRGRVDTTEPAKPVPAPVEAGSAETDPAMAEASAT